MRILLVEDDEALAYAIRRDLVRFHYSVDVASDGEAGLELALVNDYDLIILDILLPKMDGNSICRELRAAEVSTPILMLTGLDTADYTIRCLDDGADDYMTKPFDFGVLQARVRTLIRRQNGQRTAEIKAADLVIHTATRTVYRGGTQINLTSKEFALLEYLVMHRGEVMTREAIGEHIWDSSFDPKSNVIESLMRAVRLKVDRDYAVPLLETVRGVGYRFADIG